VEIAIRRHRRFIRKVAKRRSRRNPAFVKDLEQEDYIYVWELDPTRFDPAEAVDMKYVEEKVAERIRKRAREWGREGPG
jgi:hypothetical protein